MFATNARLSFQQPSQPSQPNRHHTIGVKSWQKHCSSFVARPEPRTKVTFAGAVTQKPKPGWVKERTTARPEPSRDVTFGRAVTPILKPGHLKEPSTISHTHSTTAPAWSGNEKRFSPASPLRRPTLVPSAAPSVSRAMTTAKSCFLSSPLQQKPGCGCPIPRKQQLLSASTQTEETFVEPCPEPFYHEGVKCDHCGSENIVGVRWKCAHCPDYNICSACERLEPHVADHAFLKITTPRPFKAGRIMVGLGPRQYSAEPTHNDHAAEIYTQPVGNYF